MDERASRSSIGQQRGLQRSQYLGSGIGSVCRWNNANNASPRTGVGRKSHIMQAGKMTGTTVFVVGRSVNIQC